MDAPIPCLWFHGNAEEAVRFYTSVVPGSGITRIRRMDRETPGRQAGDVLSVEFTLGGKAHMALNGGPNYSFTPAISLFLLCEDQEEVDRTWDALLDGGTPVQCGWITDRYGLSWQIVPKGLGKLLEDPEKGDRAMAAMLGQVKIDLAEIEAACAA